MKTLWLIDRQTEWLDFACRVLANAGYEVYVVNPCDLKFDEATMRRPSLTLLGCQSFGDAELQLLARLVAAQHLVLVVCSASATMATMRSMFRLGAVDVAAKPQDPQRILELVQRTLERLEDRDYYHLVAHALK